MVQIRGKGGREKRKERKRKDLVNLEPVGLTCKNQTLFSQI